MSKFWKVFFVALVSLVLIVFASCDDASDETKKDDVNVYMVFYDAAKDILPDYSAGSRAVWELGSPIYELYGILEDDDDVQVGYFNIYDTLNNADERFSETINSGNTISSGDYSLDYSKSSVLGSASYDTYMEYSDDGYRSDTFVKQSGTKMNMLNIVIIDNDGEKSKSFVEGHYDEESGDVEVEIFMANYVEEGSNTGWELVRAYFEGNTTNHTFSLKVIRDGTGYDHNVLGEGVSQGDGYFLLKLANNAVEITDHKFYTVNADATVEELKVLEDTGSDTAEAAGDTEEYVNNLLEAFTSEDLPADQDAAESLDLSVAAPEVDGSSD
ncbi:MAG: hypothetical protein PF637_06520 [Spirochaetes bacterium]|nr:hypothetical protein [Spirochaetota bacterium]